MRSVQRSDGVTIVSWCRSRFRSSVGRWIGLASLALLAASCSGPIPMTVAIIPRQDETYLTRLNSENHNGRLAFLKWRAEQRNQTLEEAERADAALSTKRNPFDAYKDADAVSLGAITYKYHCARCHGDDAMGHGPSVLPGHPANDFKSFGQRFAATLHRGAPMRWFKSITQGYGDKLDYPDDAGGKAMPAFGDKLAREQVWLVITYLQSLDAHNPKKADDAGKK